jgi:hypothetical protein
MRLVHAVLSLRRWYGQYPCQAPKREPCEGTTQVSLKDPHDSELSLVRLRSLFDSGGGAAPDDEAAEGSERSSPVFTDIWGEC